MSITVNKKNFRTPRTSCLTKADIKSLSELSQEMSTAINDDTILRIARKIIRENARNDKAENNEKNIDIILNYIIANTSKGDYITFDSVRSEIWELKHLGKCLSGYGARINAIPVAFARLEKEGYLKRKRMASTNKSGHCGSVLYTNVYEVMC